MIGRTKKTVFPETGVLPDNICITISTTDHVGAFQGFSIIWISFKGQLFNQAIKQPDDACNKQ
jgi:hypothetical protein